MSRTSLGSIGRHGAVYAFGMLLSRLVGLIMLPIYTRFLTPADYGLLQLVTMTIEVVSILAGSRLVGGVFRFYHKAENEEERRSVVTTAIALMGALYAMAALLATALAPFLAAILLDGPEQAYFIRLGALALALDGLIVVPLAFMQIRGMSGRYVLTNVSKLMVALSCNILFVVYYRMGAQGVLTGTVIANGLIGAAITTWTLRHVGLRPNGKAAGDLVRFGMPFVLTQVATFASTFGDRYFINAVAGTAAVGLYSLGYQFAFLYWTVAFAPFATAWQSARFELAKRDDRDRLYSQVLIYASAILLVGGVGVALFAQPTIRVMADPAFHTAADIVPILILAFLFQAWTELVSTGLLVSERTKHIAWANYVSMAVSLAGWAIMVPIWREAGAAVVTLIAFAVRFLMVYRSSQRAWRIAYRWGSIAKATVGCSLIAGAQLMIPDWSLIPDVAARTVLFLTACAVVWFVAFPDHDERRRLLANVRHPMALFTGAASSPPNQTNDVRGAVQESSA